MPPSLPSLLVKLLKYAISKKQKTKNLSPTNVDVLTVLWAWHELKTCSSVSCVRSSWVNSLAPSSASPQVVSTVTQVGPEKSSFT